MSVNYPRGSGKTLAPKACPPTDTSLCSSTDTNPADAAGDFALVPAPDAKRARRNKQIEWSEQRTYFDQVNTRLDEKQRAAGFFVALPGFPGADMIYAIPNSNVAGQVVGDKLVKSGLRRGYPDISVDVARTVRGHVYHGLRIELKQTQGVPSNVEVHQRHWHEKLRDQGYRVCVCFGWREAWAVTCDYLGWENRG